MSSIADMVLFVGFGDDEAIGRLNAWCAVDDQLGQRFERLDTDAAGGTKVFACEVWAMAGNYFAWEKLADLLPTFGWRYPQSVVLVVDSEHFDDKDVRVFRAAKNAGGDQR